MPSSGLHRKESIVFGRGRIYAGAWTAASAFLSATCTHPTPHDIGFDAGTERRIGTDYTDTIVATLTY